LTQETGNPCDWRDADTDIACPNAIDIYGLWGGFSTDGLFHIAGDPDGFGAPFEFTKALSDSADCLLDLLEDMGDIPLSYADETGPCDFFNATCTVISVS
jgi:hypothetical protein